MAERLQKIIAAAGIASRRKAEELIVSGAVSVNGQLVTELGAKADPATDHIKVFGKVLKPAQPHVYLLMNKPRGFVTTSSDEKGRATVLDLLTKPAVNGKPVHVRVYPVGRLDYNTEGLLLLTNDGDLAHKLTHASSHVPKIYLVKTSGQPTADALENIRRGVMVPEGDEKSRRVRTAPAKVKKFREGDNPWFEVTIIEGRNRQIHKMFDAVGHRVEKIKRVKYGPLELDVELGEYRFLDAAEIGKLQRSIKSPTAARSAQSDLHPRPARPDSPARPKWSGSPTKKHKPTRQSRRDG